MADIEKIVELTCVLLTHPTYQSRVVTTATEILEVCGYRITGYAPDGHVLVEAVVAEPTPGPQEDLGETFVQAALETPEPEPAAPPKASKKK